MKRELKWLAACGALVAGEALAWAAGGLAAAWPAVALAMAMTALFGFGFRLRGWLFAVVLLAGVLLEFVVLSHEAQARRERFWLRDRTVDAAWCEANSARHWLTGLRRDFSERVGIGLEHAPGLANLNRAILLGERAKLPPKLKRTFVDSGTIHVFAISGLHVMMVARVIMYLLVLAGFPYRFVGVVTIPLLWLYVLVIGSPPSAVRAAVMATFYFSSPLFWRRSSGIMSWSLTFLLVYGFNPQAIQDVGCALSFAVMLGIVLWGRYSQRFGRKWVTDVGIALVAWAMGVPISAHVFGRVTPGGLLANLALLPAAGQTVTAGVIGVLVSFIHRPLAAHLNNFSALFTEGMVGIARAVSSLPSSSVGVSRWPLWECGAWYAAMLLAWLLIHLVWKRRSRL